MQVAAWLCLLAAVGQIDISSESCSCAACQQKAYPARAVAEATTDHLIVRSYSPSVDAQVLATHADNLRQRLVTQWLGDESAKATWTPRCEVIVHGTRASYLRSVGAAGGSTSGSTLIRVDAGKIAVRRIDLLADQIDRPFQTVGHELVHVIFAERFPKQQPPRWAEEGAALLSDNDAKRGAHRRDFAQALRSGGAFHVNDLVRMDDYPPPTRFAAFYGQSLVLVEFLSRLGEPADFVRFVDRVMATSHDEALNEVYGIANAKELEALWRERAVKVALAAN